MNIAVDIGNSFIKTGTFEDGRLSNIVWLKNISDLINFINKNNPENIIISSVSHDTKSITHSLNKELKTLILTHELPVPIINKYMNPKTLGFDRLAASVGAYTLYPNMNSLSVDLGTCVTYDIINEKGEYLGGSISPGIMMKFKALHTFTSRLPLVEAVREAALIGTTTEESILSGVINGTLAEIESMISKYYNIFNNLQVIICGGDAKFFETRIKAPIFVIPELVLIGLNRILEHNV